MDIERAVAGLGNVEEVSGLSVAWRWSFMSRFMFSLAMDADGRWAYQMDLLDVHDDGLTRAVLDFARRRRFGRGPGSRPLTVATGFSYGSYRFDAVAAVAPLVHGYHRGRNEALNEVVSAVFLAYGCEFRGDESLEQAVLRVKRMLRPTIISRPPVPYLLMRYENTRTGGGSVGRSRGFATHGVLLRELGLLEGAPGSFVEFENSRGQVWNVEWDGSWPVNGAAQDVPPSGSWVASVLGCP
ncbi:hypothetical protein [Streptomyces virginiae]